MVLEKGKKYDVEMLIMTGWTDVRGSGHEGYSADYYFEPDGTYLGPDQYGIEPVFADID